MNNLVLTYQGGKRLQTPIAATAGNVDTNLSPATGKRWKVVRGIITLVADANAANRYIRLRITDGTDIIEVLGITDVITAGQTRVLNIGEVVFMDTFNPDNFYVGVQNLWIEEADQLRISIDAGLAGDSYSGFLAVLEI